MKPSCFCVRSKRLLVNIEGDEESSLAEGEDTATALQRVAPKIYALNDLSKQESIDADARGRLQTQLTQVEEELTEANETLQRFQAMMDDFCKAAGCTRRAGFAKDRSSVATSPGGDRKSSSSRGESGPIGRRKNDRGIRRTD